MTTTLILFLLGSTDAEHGQAERVVAMQREKLRLVAFEARE